MLTCQRSFVVSGVVIYPGSIPHNNAVQKLLSFINNVTNAWERQSHMKSFVMVCNVLWHPAHTHFFVTRFSMAMLCVGMWVTAHCQYLSCLTESTAFLWKYPYSAYFHHLVINFHQCNTLHMQKSLSHCVLQHLTINGWMGKCNPTRCTYFSPDRENTVLQCFGHQNLAFKRLHAKV